MTDLHLNELEPLLNKTVHPMEGLKEIKKKNEKLNPLDILEKAFNKYIKNNNTPSNSLAIVVEYTEELGGTKKNMYLIKRQPSAQDTPEITREYTFSKNVHWANDMFNTYSNRKDKHPVDDISKILNQMKNWYIESIVLCEIYEEKSEKSKKEYNDQIALFRNENLPLSQLIKRGFIIPIDVLYADKRKIVINKFDVNLSANNGVCTLCDKPLTMTSRKEICVLKCKHIFHCRCIREKIGEEEGNCPICDTKINPEDDIQGFSKADIRNMDNKKYKYTPGFQNVLKRPIKNYNRRMEINRRLDPNNPENREFLEDYTNPFSSGFGKRRLNLKSILADIKFLKKK